MNVRTANCITDINNASVVNIKHTAIVSHDKGKLKAAPKIVSVTDSCKAFLSIFIKILIHHLYVYSHPDQQSWGVKTDLYLRTRSQKKRILKKRDLILDQKIF